MTMRWLLPEYFEDILPEEAARIERLRRLLLDLFAGRGYELVMPPLLEYVESLLTGTGHDLDLRTFKLVDQLEGSQIEVVPGAGEQRLDVLEQRRHDEFVAAAGEQVEQQPAQPLDARGLLRQDVLEVFRQQPAHRHALSSPPGTAAGRAPSPPARRSGSGRRSAA